MAKISGWRRIPMGPGAKELTFKNVYGKGIVEINPSTYSVYGKFFPYPKIVWQVSYATPKTRGRWVYIKKDYTNSRSAERAAIAWMRRHPRG